AAIHVEEVAVVAGRGEGEVAQGQGLEDAAEVGCRVFNADLPRAAGGGESLRLHLAADGDEVVGDAEGVEVRGDGVGGVACGDTAEVDLEGGVIFPQRGRGCTGVEVLVADVGAGGGDVGVGGNAAEAEAGGGGAEAP